MELRLPEELTERARLLAEGRLQPATPRDAATVVLLRDSADRGVEIYFLRRAASMRFAAGMHVFPGGTVDERDTAPAMPWTGPPAEEWASWFAAGAPLARALVCAAVRETFEEAGVLLAGPYSDAAVTDPRGADWDSDRDALIDHSLSLIELLDRRGLVLRSDLLRPWAHWITPEVEPRRYDTRFFVAALPEGQRARDVGGEADRAMWMRPSDAAAAYQRGDMAMLPPTAASVAELADFDSVASVLHRPRTVRPWMPKVRVVGGQAYLLLPGDGGYRA